jgi:hypothetical protein
MTERSRTAAAKRPPFFLPYDQVMPRVLLAVLLIATSPALADAPPAGSIREVVQQLIDEAKAVQAGEREARRKADFAEDYGRTLTAQAVVTRLLRSQHADPFVDAYVRWQLTSFDAPLPALGRRKFESFLETLPDLAPNPMADPELLRTLDRAREIAPLDEDQQSRLRGMLDDVQRRTNEARAANEPALRFRAWIIDAMPEDDPRGAQASVERCAALLAARWDLDRAKAEVARRCEALDGLGPDDRRRLARQAEALLEPRALIVTRARLEGTSVSVRYKECAVYDFDVRAWLRAAKGRG